MNMNQHEFLAWLEGFTAALNGAAPTPEQWKLVLSQARQLKSPYNVLLGGQPKIGPAYAGLPGQDKVGVPL